MRETCGERRIGAHVKEFLTAHDVARDLQPIVQRRVVVGIKPGRTPSGIDESQKTCGYSGCIVRSVVNVCGLLMVSRLNFSEGNRTNYGSAGAY